MATTTDSSMASQDAAMLLMNRLQGQFGDMDLGSLLTTSENAPSATHDDHDDDHDDDSDESSLAEPSPEELRAWQEAQFLKGSARLQAQQLSRMTPLQRRRREERGSSAPHHPPADDWEQLPATPVLAQRSEFFPAHEDESWHEFVGGHPLLPRLAEGDADVLGTPWRRLFASWDGDGLSFATLWHALHGYPGPTVLLLATRPSEKWELTKEKEHGQDPPNQGRSSRSTIGFYTTSTWTASSEYYGSDDCFLFSLDHCNNQVQFFKPLSRARNKEGPTTNKTPHTMYSFPSSFDNNSTTLSPNNKSAGIGIGGTSYSRPRLWLTESLEDCRALPYDAVFEPGDLFQNTNHSNYYFDVDHVEVWAVGGDDWIDESLLRQQEVRALAEAHQQRCHRVKDKRLLLDHFFSGDSSSGVSHRPTSLTNTSLFEYSRDVATERCDC